MAEIADLSDLLNRRTSSTGPAETVTWLKRYTGQVPVVGGIISLWTGNGQPSAGAAPGAAAIPTSATTGALRLTNPTGGRQKWLTSASTVGSVCGGVILYDRLMHNSGLSGVVTTAQTVQGTGTPTPAITRYTDGVGNVAFIEVYTSISSTARTITMSYVDQDGSDQTSQSRVIGSGLAWPAATGSMGAMPLVNGGSGLGVRAVRTVTLSGSTGLTGNFGVTLAHPLAFMPIASLGHGGWVDFATGLPRFPEIKPDACLALMVIASSAITPEFFGSVAMVEA